MGSSFSLTTAIAITALISLLISAFLVALSRTERASGVSNSYAWLATAYGFNGLRLACQLLVINGVVSVTVVGDIFYIVFVSAFWLGVRTYSQPVTPNSHLIAIPSILVVWVFFARSTGIPFLWLAIPSHLYGMIIFAGSGFYIWSLYKSNANKGHLMLAQMMLIQAVSTASYPFTRNTWYAPYGFSLFALLATAIGIGFIISALQVEKSKLREEMEARKLAEEARKKSSDLIENIMSNSPTGILVYEGDTGNCIHANKAIADMIGGTIEDLLLQNFRSIKSWNEAGIDRLSETTLNDGLTRHQEAMLHSSFGKKVMIDYFITRFKLDGKPHLLFVASDISDRKNLEAQLLQSQKMESIGRLAGGVAHDFNNMLGVIMVYAEMSKRHMADSNKLSNHLDQILNAALRSQDITRQLLSFSRKEVVSPKSINLNAYIIATENTLGRLIGEDINLSFKPDADACNIRIDPSQLDQILINLAVNARDAMPNGGKLLIATSNIHIDESYYNERNHINPGDYAQLTVSDTGVGMSQEVQEHIFEPFFTTKEMGKGTGLGLATVYGIVTQNNGFINVYSEINIGSSFKIYFPRSMEEITTESTPETPTLVGTGTILLVEDDSMVRDMTTQALEDMGYNVINFGVPEEAIAYFMNDKVNIDLILTDLIMPEMNGRDMVDAIKAIHPNINVLFMSGYAADLVSHHGVLSEGMNFIQKPFDMKTLNNKILESRTHNGKSGSCESCNATVDSKVVYFCRLNKKKFDSKILCRDCQQKHAV